MELHRLPDVLDEEVIQGVRDFLDTLLGKKQSGLDGMNRAVRVMTADIPGNALEGLTFSLTPESFREGQERARMGENVVLSFVAYSSGEEPEYRYTLYVRLGTRDQLYFTPVGVIREDLSWNLDRLNLATGTWARDSSSCRLNQMAHSGTGEAALLWACAQLVGNPTPIMDPSSTLGLVRRHRRLCKLYEQLDGAARFRLEEQPGKQPGFCLVAGDPNRCGAAIFADKDGYSLWQMVTLEDVRAAFGEEDDVVDYRYEEGEPNVYGETPPFLYLYRVDGNKEEKEILPTARMLWDHFSGGTRRYAIPLSMDRYVESKDPFHKFQVMDQTGPIPQSALTQEEKRTLRYVRMVFDRDRLIRVGDLDREKDDAPEGQNT